MEIDNEKIVPYLFLAFFGGAFLAIWMPGFLLVSAAAFVIIIFLFFIHLTKK